MSDETPFNTWSFLRDALVRGAAIQQDSAAGHYPSYEAYSARLDAAARELADILDSHLMPFVKKYHADALVRRPAADDKG